MTYAIITTCFVRVENFNCRFYFMFSAVFPNKHLKAGHDRPPCSDRYKYLKQKSMLTENGRAKEGNAFLMIVALYNCLMQNQFTEHPTINSKCALE